MRKSKNRHFYHIFVSPGDAPAAITQNVAWMKRQFNACQTLRSMYPSIFNSFSVIRTASAKNRRFDVPQPTFCFSWRRPCDYHAICCMDGKTIQCLSNPSQHVPIYLQQFPSYAKRNCKKIAVFTYCSPHFCFPWRRPYHYHVDVDVDRKQAQAIASLPDSITHYYAYSNEDITVISLRLPEFRLREFQNENYIWYLG